MPNLPIDRLIFPDHLNEGVFVTEGLLATIPAIATGLLGVFTGHFIRDNSLNYKPLRKGIVLGIAGIILLALWLFWFYSLWSS